MDDSARKEGNMKLKEKSNKDEGKKVSLRKTAFFSVILSVTVFSALAIKVLFASEVSFCSRVEAPKSKRPEGESFEIKEAEIEKVIAQKKGTENSKLDKKNLSDKKTKPLKKTKKKDGKKKGMTRKKDTLIIGDSIAYGMSLNNSYTGVNRVNEYYWLTEGGVSIGFIPKNLKLVLGRVMPRSITNTLSSSVHVDLVKDVKAKKIKNVVFFLGLNGSSRMNAERTVERMEKLKEATGCRVFYLSALPVVDSKAKKFGYRTGEANVKQFNSWVKEDMEGKGLFYVDAFAELKKDSAYQKDTQDGIHYSRKTYNKVIKKLAEEIRKVEKKEKNPRKLKKSLKIRIKNGFFETIRISRIEVRGHPWYFCI